MPGFRSSRYRRSRLRQRREERGWTQQQLAEELGVTVETIRRYEAGRLPRVTSGRMIRLCHLLQVVTPGYFHEED